MDRPQRRQKFIDSSVQGALARRVIFHWLVFLAVASVAALMLQVLSDPFRPISEHLANVWYTQGPFLIVMIFLLPVFVVDTVKISHRFVGPVQSLRRTMRAVANGQPPRKLQFRKQDFWHELADDYNALIARLAPTAKEQASSEDEQNSPEPVAR
jgi:nitrogen fixation/metabolism regulation signal transduction histidine kinase